MDRFSSRKKIEVSKQDIISQKEEIVLKGKNIITGNNGKVEKKKKMFYLSEVLLRAIEIYNFEQKNFKSESDICSQALENFIPREIIDRADRELKTL